MPQSCPVAEKPSADILFKLIATVKAGDDTTKTVEYSCKVPAYALNTHAEYIAAEKDDVVTVEGIVTAVLSNPAYGDKTNKIVFMRSLKYYTTDVVNK